MSSSPERGDAGFRSLYSHGFVRVAAAVPHLRVADPEFNAERTTGLARQASDAGAAVVVFPELGLSAYAIDDLLHQRALLDAVLAALSELVAASAELAPVLVVGAPLLAEGGVFNSAVVIHRGRILGVVPKSYLPEYREYYEKRQFRAARDVIGGEIRLLGEPVPWGGRPRCSRAPTFPTSASTWRSARTCGRRSRRARYGALAGATVLANLSASNITVGKADYRHLLCAARSRRGRSPPTSTRRPGSASRRPTSPGTARR